ncbi:MAG: MFS transporter [Christensenellales bacterium]
MKEKLLAMSREKKSVLFLISQSITLFGSTLVQMAIIWFVAMTTASGVWVSAFTVCAYLPQFLISFTGGILADRYDKKKIIIASDSIIALSTLGLFIAMPYVSNDNAMLGIILGVSVIRSLGAGIQTPTINATIPILVPKEKLMKFNGINSTMQSVVQFAAPAVAGLVLSFSSLRYIFIIDVATAVVGIGMLLFVLFPKQERKNSSVWGDMKVGLKYSFSDKFLRKLLITFGIFIFLCVPAGFLASLFVSINYGNEYWYLSAVEIVGFVGMLIGGIIMTAWGGFKNRVTTLFAGIVAFGILAIGMGVIPNFIVYLILMFFYGIALTMVQTATTTMIQEKSDPSKTGSVFGVMSALYSGFLPVGMLVFGPLADLINLRWIMAGSGVLLIILSLTVILNKKFRYAPITQSENEIDKSSSESQNEIKE